MTYQEKSKWLSSNPLTAARHFHYRLNAFFQNVLKSSANPLGKVVDYAIRIEFQARGSPHAHTLIWVEGAPKHGIDPEQEICDFIDKYITCEIPENDEELKKMVLLLQQQSLCILQKTGFLSIRFSQATESLHNSGLRVRQQ